MLRFQQSTIANKILLGFLPLIVLLGGIPIFALVNLDKLTEMNQKIVHEDLFIIESIDDLFNELFLQESFGQHYLIRQTEEIKQRFIDHGDAFKALLSKLKKSAFNSTLLGKIDVIYVHHHRYHILYLTHYQASEALFSDNPIINNKKISTQFDELSRLINEVKKDAYEHQENQIRQMAAISDRAYRIMAGLSIGGILIGIGSAYMAFRYTRRSIHKLIRATQEIASGNFNVIPQIKGAGELQTLANAFAKMGKRLATLEKRNLNTNPLTHLPGGATIEAVLETRLENKLPSAFCLADIDNFKAFNDRYGYATGNSIIKETANIIQAVTSRFGTDHDFVGHIGGDDFVFLTIPGKYEDICKEIIDRFDTRVPKFYTLEDAERGFIESTSRQGEEMHFPIMTLSIAVVTNVGRSESNHIRFGEIAAELKKKAKNIDGSVFVVDQRRE